MTYHWTEADVISGRWVCKPTAYHHSDRIDRDWRPDGGTAKWTELIGYANGTGDDVVLIALVDGMVSQSKTAAEVAERLNKQGMIPMPHAWLLKTIDYLRDCHVAT